MDNSEKLATYRVNRKEKNQDKNKTQYAFGHHYAQTNTNNVNKTRVLLQTTGGKDESNIVFMRNS